jgi:hypothetical protein
MEEPGAPERSEWGRDDICIFLPVIFQTIPKSTPQNKCKAVRPCERPQGGRAAVTLASP